MTQFNCRVFGGARFRNTRHRVIYVLAWVFMASLAPLHGCNRKEPTGPPSGSKDGPIGVATNSVDSRPTPPLAVNPLCMEHPAFFTFSGGRYDAVTPGPIGARIIEYQKPEDMGLLIQALVQTDGPRTLRVIKELPLRCCDYALMIAERLPGEVADRYRSHSFNQFTPYERRDAVRYELLKRVFKIPPPAEMVKYRYLDEQGRDVSKSYRETPDWP